LFHKKKKLTEKESSRNKTILNISVCGNHTVRKSGDGGMMMMMLEMKKEEEKKQFIFI
jgi:hypothetical protein